MFVIGTSLQVFPVAGIVDKVSNTTPRVLINRDMVHTANCTGQKDDYGKNVKHGEDGQFLVSTDGFWWGDKELEKHNYRDVFLSGNCDDSICNICDLLGWREEFNTLIAQDSKNSQEPAEDEELGRRLAKMNVSEDSKENNIKL